VNPRLQRAVAIEEPDLRVHCLATVTVPNGTNLWDVTGNFFIGTVDRQGVVLIMNTRPRIGHTIRLCEETSEYCEVLWQGRRGLVRAATIRRVP